jgi:hypothetical protein
MYQSETYAGKHRYRRSQPSGVITEHNSRVRLSEFQG